MRRGAIDRGAHDLIHATTPAAWQFTNECHLARRQCIELIGAGQMFPDRPVPAIRGIVARYLAAVSLFMLGILARA